jgi:hypothetical protein
MFEASGCEGVAEIPACEDRRHDGGRCRRLGRLSHDRRRSGRRSVPRPDHAVCRLGTRGLHFDVHRRRLPNPVGPQHRRTVRGASEACLCARRVATVGRRGILGPRPREDRRQILPLLQRTAKGRPAPLHRCGDQRPARRGLSRRGLPAGLKRSGWSDRSDPAPRPRQGVPPLQARRQRLWAAVGHLWTPARRERPSRRAAQSAVDQRGGRLGSRSG